MSDRNLNGFVKCSMPQISDEFTGNTGRVISRKNSQPKSKEASVGIDSEGRNHQKHSNSIENITGNDPIATGKKGAIQSNYLLHIIASDNSIATELLQKTSRKVVTLTNDNLMDSP